MVDHMKQGNLLELMQYGSAGMHIENVFHDVNKQVNLLILGTGQHLKPHALDRNVFAVNLEGKTRVVFMKQDFILNEMDFIVLPKNELHEIYALEDSKLLLLK